MLQARRASGTRARRTCTCAIADLGYLADNFDLEDQPVMHFMWAAGRNAPPGGWRTMKQWFRRAWSIHMWAPANRVTDSFYSGLCDGGEKPRLYSIVNAGYLPDCK